MCSILYNCMMTLGFIFQGQMVPIVSANNALFLMVKTAHFIIESGHLSWNQVVLKKS